MGFSLLAPIFLMGLAALAVPILVHLADRDRRDVVRFPSLKFLRRLPYRQTRRQRIRHPWLFALRVAALVALVLAFTRPLLDGEAAMVDDTGRDVVIALDRSYSMGYAETWPRALRAVRERVAALSPGTRATLVGFSETAEVLADASDDHQGLALALQSLAPGSGGTRFAPALRLANEVLLDSAALEREVVLVSDFQSHAWDRAAGTRLAPGLQLDVVDLSTPSPVNVMVAGVEMRRSGDDAASMATVRLVNQGPDAVLGLGIAATIDGRTVAEDVTGVPADGAATLRLGPIPQAGLAGVSRVTLRIGHDALADDDVFFLTLAPSPPVPVLLVTARSSRAEAALYLREALAISEDPTFGIVARTVDRLRVEDVEAASVVVLHDSPAPTGALSRALAEHVARGGGLWVVLGSRSAAVPSEVAALLPGTWEPAVDRLDVQGVSLAGVDYGHPVFEIFAGPDDGNVSGPRFYRYRPLSLAETGAQVLARYTDGAVAMAERRHGEGRVLLSGAPFDNRWSNLPVQPVFVPFVHRVVRYLSGRQSKPSWRQVGQVVAVKDLLSEVESEAGEVVVETPSGRRLAAEVSGGESFVTLEEAGFYEIRVPDREASYPLAVNVDRAESDLTRLDTEAFVAASTSAAEDPEGVSAARGSTREERERRQGTWWFLVFGALLALAAESMVSNRFTVSSPSSTPGRSGPPALR